jgi:sigma-B regulation protein RsbU (phosphoserine phosphatase)
MEGMDVTLSEPIVMQPGDIFAVLSDGIYEAANASGELFGTERTIEVIRENRDRSADEIMQAIRQAVTDYTHNAPPEDDRTGIIIKRT